MTPILKWCLYHNDPTSPARQLFAIHYYLPLVAIDGVVLGLIPTHRLRELSRSIFASFTATTESKEDDSFTQPQFWAWLPVGSLLLLRVITWRPR